MPVYLEGWGISRQGLSLEYKMVALRRDDRTEVAREDLALLIRTAPQVQLSVVDQGARVIIDGAPEWFRDHDGLPLAWPDLIHRCREQEGRRGRPTIPPCPPEGKGGGGHSVRA